MHLSSGAGPTSPGSVRPFSGRPASAVQNLASQRARRAARATLVAALSAGRLRTRDQPERHTDEFLDMVSRCGKAGVDIYVDAVINHMTAQSSGTGSNGTQYTKYAVRRAFRRGRFSRSAMCDCRYRLRQRLRTGCEAASCSASRTSIRRSSGCVTRITEFLADFVELGVPRISYRRRQAHLARRSAIVRQVGESTGPDKAPTTFSGDRLRPRGNSRRRFRARRVRRRRRRRHGVQVHRGRRQVAEQGRLEARKLRTLMKRHGTCCRVARRRVHDQSRSRRSSSIYSLTARTSSSRSVFLLASPYGYPSILSSYAFDRSAPAGRDTGPPADGSGKTLSVYADGSDSPSCAADPATASPGAWLCQHRRP